MIHKKFGASFFTTLGLLTRLPIPLRYSPDFSLFPLYFPLAGVLFTSVITAVYLAATALLKNPSVTAGTVLLVQYLMFNLFHFDGLLDSADALLYSTDRETRLKILKDKSSGSFAVFAGALYIILKFTVLKELISSYPPLSDTVVLFSYITAGRISGGIVPALLKPAREGGLGALLKGYSRGLFTAGAAAAAGITMVFLYPAGGLTSAAILPAAAALLAAAAAGILTVIIFRKGIGGFTGDAVGLAVELGELGYLITLALTAGGK